MTAPPPEQLSPEEQRRITRAAFLRPINLLMLVIGGVSFAFAMSWWIPPVTLATYAALVFLATRDPLLRSKILGRPDPRLAALTRPSNVPPERRARRLPHGETRQKVEEALELQRRARFAVEESDPDTRTTLNDMLPRLDRTVELLLNVAEHRERTAAKTNNPRRASRNAPADPEDTESSLRASDAAISDALEQLSALRSRILRISTESGPAAHAAELNRDLDELNLRLDSF